MKTPLSLSEFLQQLEDGKHKKIEAYNYVDQITDNFKLDKLRILLEDVNDTIRSREDEHRELMEKIKPNLKARFDEQGNRIPHLKRQNGKLYDLQEELDFMIHVQLYMLHDLKEIITTKINEQISNINPDGKSKKAIEDFLTEEAINHLPVILEAFQTKTSDKKDFVKIFWALHDLKFLNKNIRSINRSDFLRTLVSTFGKNKVGEIGNFNRYFAEFDTETEHGKIETKPFLTFIRSRIKEQKK